MGIENVRGKLSLLRVHERGTPVRAANDSLDAEVITKFASRPDEAYGFQRRNGADLPAREGMLSLLREAFVNGTTVSLDFDRIGTKRISTAIRVELVKP